MKRLLGAFAFSVLLGSVAAGADLPGPPGYPLPLPAIRHTWTGCHAGLETGALFVHNHAHFSLPTYPGSPEVGTSLGGQNATGWIGGFQIGCDYQYGNVVFGAEGGWDWGHAKGSHPDPFFINTIDSSTTHQLMAVTWRLGYAFDRFLPYVKFGGGWERIEYNLGAAVNEQQGRETGGWIVGVGAEYAFNEWISTFVEYRYLDFGTCAASFVMDFGSFVANVKVRDYKSAVKLGFNLRFGG
jgi:outer membrane immunogenic protein